MPNYQVVWAIDEEADSPEQAAQQARERMLLADDTGANSWFDVYPGDQYARATHGLPTQVRLDEFGGVLDATQ